MTFGAPVVTAAEMQAAEQALFDGGVSQIELMDRAALAVAREVARFALGRPVLVLAGPGNNGGDAYGAAAYLAQWGHDVRVVALGEAKAGAATEMRARWSGPVGPLAEAKPAPVLLDGLFGTGFARALTDDVAGPLHHLVDASAFAIAIDLPSGLETDRGADLGAAQMDATIVLGAPKPAHMLLPGAAKCGALIHVDIGIPVQSPIHVLPKPKITAPGTASHKFTRGMVAVVAGQMRGAARLAARAAMHGGAGYTVLSKGGGPGPDALVHRRFGPGLLEDARIGALLIGPGLGRDDEARARLDAVRASDLPLVLDADALALVEPDQFAKHKAPMILTPHSGEFDRLFGLGEGSKIDRTWAAAKASDAVIVHKGADTVIAAPDGRAWIAPLGCPWLSTAGTGDVLAGLCAARLAGVGDPALAASQAVWLHNEAARLSGPAFIADDLISALPRAMAATL